MKRFYTLWVVLCCTQLLFSEEYTLSFLGCGDDSVVDSVHAINLTTGEAVSIAGDNQLRLNVTTGIGSVTVVPESKVPKIFPNPSTEWGSHLEVSQSTAGPISIVVAATAGNVVARYDENLEAGEHLFRLPAFPVGIYGVNVITPKSKATTKLICSSHATMASGIGIVRQSSLPYTAPSTEPATRSAGDNNVISYKQNDVLMVEAVSPAGHKTIQLMEVYESGEHLMRFIDCPSPKGGHVAVCNMGGLYLSVDPIDSDATATVAPDHMEHIQTYFDNSLIDNRLVPLKDPFPQVDEKMLKLFRINAEKRTKQAGLEGILAGHKAWSSNGDDMRRMLNILLKTTRPDTISAINGSILPQPKNYTIRDNSTELFFFGNNYETIEKKNFPKILQFDNFDNHSSVLIPSGIIGKNDPRILNATWLTYPRKAIARGNKNGTQDVVVATWADNAGSASAPFGSYAKLTLRIFKRDLEYMSYGTEVVILDEQFYVPKINSREYGGKGSHWATFGEYLPLFYDAWLSEFDIKCADLNEDGTDELIITCHHELFVYDGATYKCLYHYKVYDNPGSLAFQLRTVFTDIDGDGRKDILMTEAKPTSDYSYAYLHGFLNKPSGFERIAKQPLILYEERKGDTHGMNIKLARLNGMGSPESLVLSFFWTSENTSKKDRANMYVSTLPISMDLFKDDITIHKEEAIKLREYWFWQTFEYPNLEIAYLHGGANPPTIIAGTDLIAVKDGQMYLPYGEHFLRDRSSGHDYMVPDQMVVGKIYPLNASDEVCRDQVNYLARNGNQVELFSLFVGSDGKPVVDRRFMDYVNRVDFRTNMLHFWAQDKNFPLLVGASTKSQGRVLRFNRREFAITLPTVEAVLGTPIYYAKYDSLKLYKGSKSTKYGSASSEGTSQDNEHTTFVGLGGGFNYEQSIPLIGTKVFGLSFMANVKGTFTKGFSQSTIKTEGKEYSTSGDAMVIFKYVPKDIYYYDIISSPIAGQVGKTVQYDYPRSMVTANFSLSRYNELVGGNSFTIDRKKVLQHIPGYPDSYLIRSRDEKRNKEATGANSFIWLSETGSCGAGGGDSNHSLEIAKSSGSKNSKRIDATLETVLTVFMAKQSTNVGYANTNTISTTLGNKISVKGTVPNLPDEGGLEDLFNWCLVWYDYKIQDQTFHVVNYMVDPNP